VTRSDCHRRRTARLLAGIVLCGAVFAALPVATAGAATRATAPESARVTAPAPWAKSVCGALDAWVRAVTKASSKAADSSPTTAAATKKALTGLLNRTVKETAKVRAKLAKAGKPSVSGGKQIAATVNEGFRQVNSSLKGAKQSLAAADPADAATFTAAVRGTQDALESGLESIQAAFSAARDADASALVTAFAAEPTCQAVAS
jgi:hypothetical protein